MKQIGGNWFPDHEQHMLAWMAVPKNHILVDGRQTYQHRKQEAAFGYVKNWRTAIDVGGHVGLWSWPMTKRFATTFAFEPIAEHRACFLRNVPGSVIASDELCNPGTMPELHEWGAALASAPDVRALLFPFALGADAGRVRLFTERGSSGNTSVIGDAVPMVDAGEGELAEMRTLDSFAFDDIDFIKIDCEGYEPQVLEGAVETLLRCKPTIIVEQKEHVTAKNFGYAGAPAVKFVEKLGAKLLREFSGDYILAWDR